MLGPVDFESYLIIALIFIQLELFFPLRPQKIFRKHWLSDVAYLLVNGALVQLGLLAAIAGMMFAIRAAVPHGVAAAVQSQPLWLQVLEVMIVADLGFYAAHRAFHAVPFLWKFHAVHHSIEELDWLAAFRVHAVDQILTKSASYLPVYALGFSDPAVLVFVFIFRWQSVLIHSNSRVDFGPFKWLLASPLFHHWHHAHDPAARDKNFAGQLSLVDWLGGTLYMPSTMPAAYGTDTKVPPLYHQQLVYPLRPTAPVPVLSGDIAA